MKDGGQGLEQFGRDAIRPWRLAIRHAVEAFLYRRASICPSNIDWAIGGVEGMSFAQGNGTWGFTEGDLVMVAAACEVRHWMTS